MSTPLSPIASSSLNTRTPTTARRRGFSNAPKSPLVNMEDGNDEITYTDAHSSPFISLVEQENVARQAEPEPSNEKKEDAKMTEDEQTFQTAPKTPVDILPPIKTSHTNSRSPRKTSSIEESSAPAQSEQTLRDNEGLTVAMHAMEQERLDATFGDISYYQNTHATTEELEEQSNIDDTCFSTFSEVPNTDMTMFAKLGNRSPTKQSSSNARTPRKTPATPTTARKREYNGYDRSPSPTPRRHKSPSLVERDGETTNLLLDFTQQIESFASSTRRSSSRRHSPSKSATESNLRVYLNNQRSPAKSAAMSPSTPGRNHNLLNLLDFELPPMPTPRSIPSITVRELESVKSNFQSQISSLTATLSGRAAEVDSLKRAVSDAERRVGEAQERVREERSAREHAEKEKVGWEKRGIEVEEVLRSIREEVISNEKEREELLRKLDESERKAEEAEARSADLETRTIEAEGKIVDQSIMTTAEDHASGPRYTAEEVQRQIDEKVATLCRELHVVYKKKHETKVAALKKSYEAKAEKKHAELTRKVDELSKQIEELQAGRDATFSGVLPADFDAGNAQNAAAREADIKRLEEQKSEIEQQKARLAGLEGQIEAVRAERGQLLKELENERREKGELVAAVDEMLALQTDESTTPQQQRAVADDLRRSVNGGSGAGAAASGISRPSGLRGPGFGAGAGESRIGKMGPLSGLNRGAGAGANTKSRMMSNIERMGMGGGRTFE